MDKGHNNSEDHLSVPIQHSMGIVHQTYAKKVNRSKKDRRYRTQR